MNLRKSRAASFIIVAFVYVIAIVVGVVSYLYLPFDFWLNLLLADIIATAVTFIFSVIFNNASVYDPYWSVQPIVITLAFALFSPELNLANILPVVAILIWGVRLTVNWAYTFHGLEHQDWRYTMLKEKTGILYPFVNFFGIHLVPTLVVYAATMPAVYLLYEPVTFNFGSVIFFFVSLGAVILQGVADYQMHAFRKGGQGGFIRSGLWAYSRHPNYLGEILMWWGVALAAVCVMPNKWYLLLGAILNTALFLFISIPLADGHQARKEGFETYKRETRMLLPLKK